MSEQRPDEPRIPDVKVGGRRFGPSRWVPLAALALIPLAVIVNQVRPADGTPPAAGSITVAQGDPGPQALDPEVRKKLVVAFGDGLWVPIEGKGPVRLPDEQMNVVGTGDAMRVYAMAGGGGGGPTLDWREGEVFIKVGEGLYWPLAPRQRTPPPSQVQPKLPLPNKPVPQPAPQGGDR